VNTWVPPRFEERCADPLFDRGGAVSTPSWGRFTAEYLALFREFRQFRAENRKGVFACGDGHPVIVLPGFLCCDPMTSHFRRLLEGLGYPAAGWGAGINLGPTAASLSAVEALLQQITDRYGERASLVGQSLGGVFARSLASHHPTRIRRVITVCSPFRLPTATRLEPIYRLLSPLHHGQDAVLRGLAAPPPVPTTAIYTVTDGVVAWTSCVDEPGRGRENVAIAGAHTTMLENPEAVRVITDRLARPANPGVTSPSTPYRRLPGG
jgi:pimeloyl-ACP methyl ester carboxylesterase